MNQWDSDFEVIVADDASPDDIKSVCNVYQGRLRLQYVQFETNLGGSDLTAHWQRAINLASTDWIWLMGDDDELAAGCVSAMRKQIAQEPDWPGLWRVNVEQIDHRSEVLVPLQRASSRMNAEAYLRLRCAGRLSSFACEFVFRRSVLQERGGFVSFPMAWCSDDATWLRLGGTHGIRSVVGLQAHARWRQSSENISGAGQQSHAPKLEARVRYLEWLASAEAQAILVTPKRELPKLQAILRAWFYDTLHSTRTLIPTNKIWPIAKRVGSATGASPVLVALETIRRQRWVHAALATTTDHKRSVSA